MRFLKEITKMLIEAQSPYRITIGYDPNKAFEENDPKAIETRLVTVAKNVDATFINRGRTNKGYVLTFQLPDQIRASKFITFLQKNKKVFGVFGARADMIQTKTKVAA